MNLYPSTEDRTGLPPLAPPEWTMDVGRERSNGKPHYFAEVMRHRQRVCRLVLAGADLTDDQARKALAEKARAWIADYLSRPEAGDTTRDALSEDG